VRTILRKHKQYTSNQTRRDFRLNNLTISLKHSGNWGYHVEIDTNVNDKNEAKSANKSIEQLARQLGLQLMTEDEETAHLKSVKQDDQ
jgi:adenylate cyclase class IV